MGTALSAPVQRKLLLAKISQQPSCVFQSREGAAAPSTAATFSFYFEPAFFYQWKQMTFQNQEIRALIPPHVGNLWWPLSHVPQHCHSVWPRYSASEAVSPRNEKKCFHWRIFVCLTDLVQGEDPVMAASEVEAAFVHDLCQSNTTMAEVLAQSFNI